MDITLGFIHVRLTEIGQNTEPVEIQYSSLYSPEIVLVLPDYRASALVAVAARSRMPSIEAPH